MLFSQNQADSLYLKRKALSEWRFCQNGKTLSFNEVKQLCANKALTKEPIRNIQRIRWLRYPEAVVTGVTFGLGISGLLVGNPNAAIIPYVLTASGILGFVNASHMQNTLDKEKAVLVKAYNESK